MLGFVYLLLVSRLLQGDCLSIIPEFRDLAKSLEKDYYELHADAHDVRHDHAVFDQQVTRISTADVAVDEKLKIHENMSHPQSLSETNDYSEELVDFFEMPENGGWLEPTDWESSRTEIEGLEHLDNITAEALSGSEVLNYVVYVPVSLDDYQSERTNPVDLEDERSSSGYGRDYSAREFNYNTDNDSAYQPAHAKTNYYHRQAIGDSNGVRNIGIPQFESFDGGFPFDKNFRVSLAEGQNFANRMHEFDRHPPKIKHRTSENMFLPSVPVYKYYRGQIAHKPARLYRGRTAYRPHGPALIKTRSRDVYPRPSHQRFYPRRGIHRSQTSSLTRPRQSGRRDAYRRPLQTRGNIISWPSFEEVRRQPRPTYSYPRNAMSIQDIIRYMDRQNERSFVPQGYSSGESSMDIPKTTFPLQPSANLGDSDRSVAVILDLKLGKSSKKNNQNNEEKNLLDSNYPLRREWSSKAQDRMSWEPGSASNSPHEVLSREEDEYPYIRAIMHPGRRNIDTNFMNNDQMFSSSDIFGKVFTTSDSLTSEDLSEPGETATQKGMYDQQMLENVELQRNHRI